MKEIIKIYYNMNNTYKLRTKFMQNAPQAHNIKTNTQNYPMVCVIIIIENNILSTQQKPILYSLSVDFLWEVWK